MADVERTDLKLRTKQFALRIIRLYSALPRNQIGFVLGRQLLRSGTSIGAHYREAHRSRTDAELISKFEVGLQELDETAYWLELVADSGLMPPERLVELQTEINELIAIFVACVRNTKARTSKRRNRS
jgi:four helix bundle protein